VDQALDNLEKDARKTGLPCNSNGQPAPEGSPK
jgi:hypothetical protein